ncbi:hypothetical protein MRY87_01990 [bacterium]|nr:hypothetical protein [bacterium]
MNESISPSPTPYDIILPPVAPYSVSTEQWSLFIVALLVVLMIAFLSYWRARRIRFVNRTSSSSRNTWEELCRIKNRFSEAEELSERREHLHLFLKIVRRMPIDENALPLTTLHNAAYSRTPQRGLVTEMERLLTSLQGNQTGGRS